MSEKWGLPEIEKLRRDVEILQNENSDLKKELERVEGWYNALQSFFEMLKKENEQLKQNLNTLKK